MVRIVQETGVENLLSELSSYIEQDFLRWNDFDKVARVASHSAEGVIELMPTSDNSLYGFKYVNGHPANQARGYQTVTAFGVLSDVYNGYPILFTEMTILTALRTAATSALVAKYLSRENSDTMAIIGNGAQCEFQAIAFMVVCGIKKVRLYDVSPEATDKVTKNLQGYNIEVVSCDSVDEALLGADIITTCTADKKLAKILTDKQVESGVHINAIGGDCPGKTELDKSILLRSNIFVEFTPQTRVEGEIQQLQSDHPVTEMWQVFSGEAKGRLSNEEITIFDGVGFATEDFSALRYLHKIIKNTDKFTHLDIVASPQDTRDLFGLLK